MTGPLRIAVGVYVARGPMGGLSWHYLHYAAGLAALGHHVTVVEDSGDHAWCCYHPTTGDNDDDPAEGLAYAAACYARLGLTRWAYYDAHRSAWTGPSADTIDEELRTAEVFLNISGATTMRPWLEQVPRRVLVDTDPGFTQVRHLEVAADRSLAAAHTDFFTFGELFGQPGCSLPDDGFPWRPTRQPLALDAWTLPTPAGTGPFTTVMRWDSYVVRRHGGLELGMKSRSFQPFLDLPAESPVDLEIALGGPAPESDLRSRGWSIRDPQQVAPDPWALQDYLRSSAGEFAVAKHGYVVSRSGWFSERSANYLASGRPVVTQDTGFSSVLPTGEGLLPFSDPDSALAALREVSASPARHGAAARRLAVEFFDARKVLPAMLDQVG